MLVYYAQGLVGKRWQLYAPWSKFLPSSLMDKWASRWPPRLLWQGEIVCGDRAVLLHIYGGSAATSAWLQKLEAGQASQLVVSSNLPTQASGGSLAPGRLLLAIYLRQVLAQLGEQMHPVDDRLTVGLVARGQEMACWLANIEGVARQVTVVTDRRSRLLPLAPSGLAVRQLDLSITTIGVDVLIVAPEFLPWLSERKITPGTIVVRTDGAEAPLPTGVFGVSLDYGSMLFPTTLLADTDDIVPLKEAILLAAFCSDSNIVWPSQWSRRLAFMQQAVKRSDWQLEWRLVGTSPISAN